ncbi:replication protein A 70 kDa DNA-binding subunit A-like [Arachis hypogaea]|nr:replication protein A 70 kDa DNA-binding subunit A-like [Arachis hypogaea]
MLPSDWQMTVSHGSRDENLSSAFLCFAMALMNSVGALNQKVDAVADINPTKLAWNLKVEIVHLYEFPSKWNPREIYNMELVLQDERGDCINCSIPNSNMAKIEAMVGVNKNHLLDKSNCMGHVVGREDVTPLITKSRENAPSLFGELVDKALGLFDKDDGQPIILVAELFKPNFYLNEVNVQNSLYASLLFFNPEIPDVLAIKNRLIKRGDLKAQYINYIHSQPVNLISDELHGGSLPITTIEEVLDKTNKTSCWILATVVSIEVGGCDWYYASCKSCPKKMKENKGRYLCKHCGKVGFNAPLRYRLHVIASGGTGCIGLIIWNQEVKLVGVDQNVSNLLPASFTNEVESDVHSAAVVSSSKDSGLESIFECGLETLGKGVVADSNVGAAIGGLYSPNVQGSTTKPLKDRAGERKLE